MSSKFKPLVARRVGSLLSSRWSFCCLSWWPCLRRIQSDRHRRFTGRAVSPIPNPKRVDLPSLPPQPGGA